MLENKRRIIVVGCPGAGKSTFSLELKKKLKLPLIHLDALYWKENWTESTREEFDEKLKYALAGDEWIIDGNYYRTLKMRLERCDAVIYFDFPRVKCELGVLKRMLMNIGKTRPDMAANCPERLDWTFIKYVWNFKRNTHGQLETVINSGKETIIFKTRREASKYLEKI